MEKHLFRIAQVLSLCILLAASVASAQDRPILVQIPFDFVAMHKLFPAGEYTVRSNLSDSTVLIKSADQKQALFVLTYGVQASRIQEVPKLVFNRYGERYFLSEVWSDGTSLGRALPKPPAERSMAKRAAVNRVEILTYQPGKEGRPK